MIVVSVSDEEARKLEPEGSSGSISAMDYFERRSVPISIPDTRKDRDTSGKEFVVFNIYMASKHTASRRYREFDALNSNVRGLLPLLPSPLFLLPLLPHLFFYLLPPFPLPSIAPSFHTSLHCPPPFPSPSQLKRQFGDFIFPKLPSKWPFQLNDGQVDTRRRGLEDYLDKGKSCISHA